MSHPPQLYVIVPRVNGAVEGTTNAGPRYVQAVSRRKTGGTAEVLFFTHPDTGVFTPVTGYQLTDTPKPIVTNP